MSTLYDLLEIENTPEILRFTCPGTDYLLWPYLRTVVIRMVMDREIYGEGVLIKLVPTESPCALQKLACVVDGLMSDLHLINRRAKIVFFNSGTTNIKLDGKYFNRVSDYFALFYPQATLLIEDTSEWLSLKPRANLNVAYHLPLVTLSKFFGRLPFEKNKETVLEEFVAFLESRLKLVLGFQMTAFQRSLLSTILIRHCASLKLQLRLYQTLYEQLQPEIIFFEDGHYGSRGHLIRLAKEMGIKTAELQHGMITAGHDAYNFAPAIRNSVDYQKYVPDYFLTYGQWWSEQINSPAQAVAIGNPHYEVMSRRCQSQPTNKTKILLLSDGLRFETYFEMARSLRSLIPQSYEVVLRPHPIERAGILARYTRNSDGILLDHSDDLYARFAESYAVVGEISTALFEAIGSGNRIFVRSNPITLFGLPDCPFAQFETVEQLAAKLFTGDCGLVSSELADSIWVRGWEANYSDFMLHCIGMSD